MNPHKTKSSLVAFLYEVLRDEMSPGRMEAITRSSETKGEYTLTNGYIAAYAEEIAARLVPPPPEPDLVYHRPAGTQQCLVSCEVRKTVGTKVKVKHTHGAVCFRELGHVGPHRFWDHFDFYEGEYVVMNDAKPKRRKKEKPRAPRRNR